MRVLPISTSSPWRSARPAVILAPLTWVPSQQFRSAEADVRSPRTGLVLVARGAGLVREGPAHRLEDLPQLDHLLTAEPVEEVAPDALDVPGSRRLQHPEALVGEHRDHAPPVGGAGLATHPAELLEPGDGVGEAARGGLP